MNNNDLMSYEEQQLQIILMNELKNKLLQEERELKELQDIEYQESLLKDESKVEVTNISIEEMRQKRIQRFSK